MSLGACGDAPASDRRAEHGSDDPMQPRPIHISTVSLPIALERPNLRDKISEWETKDGEEATSGGRTFHGALGTAL